MIMAGSWLFEASVLALYFFIWNGQYDRAAAQLPVPDSNITGALKCQCPSQSPALEFDVGFSTCSSYNDDGSISEITYDTCTSFCCGGTVVALRSGIECCGSEERGSPYKPTLQKCCQWWTGHGKGHLKSRMQHPSGCCGTERINWNHQSCCHGHPDPPQVYNARTELCCNAHKVKAVTPNPWDSACCGDTTAYDQRTQSCPCGDGQVVKAPKSKTACCETPEGLKTPYNQDTQVCCEDGQVATKGTQFCCGTTGVGTVGEQVCCANKLFPVDPPNKVMTECCNGIAYDPTVNFCCNDEIVEIIGGADQCCGSVPYNSGKSICCRGNLLSRETEGTECCVGAAFFPGGATFCCNGEIFVSAEVGGDTCCGSGIATQYYYKAESGDRICCGGVLGLRTNGESCCGTTPYSNKTSICCDDQVLDKSGGDSCCQGKAYFKSKRTICCDNGPFGPFKGPRCCGGEGYDIEGGTVCCTGQVFGKYSWPACCVDVGYDAKTNSCCGSTVHPNPDGSTGGQCCGDSTYDRKTQKCCNGFSVDIPTEFPRGRAECCEFDLINNDTQLCCSGIVFNKTSRFRSKCCGIAAYQTDEQICCDAQDGSEPILHDFVYGANNSKCCGNQLYNDSTDFCCDGVVRAKPSAEQSQCCAGRVYNREKQICCNYQLQNIGENVPWANAQCCGNKCFFRGPQRCCNDRIYEFNQRSNVTCENFPSP